MHRENIKGNVDFFQPLQKANVGCYEWLKAKI